MAEISGSGTAPVFVGKVVRDGQAPQYVRVVATDTSIARKVLESRFGPAGRIEVVSTPEFLLETDPEFGSLLEQSGSGDLGAFVDSLALVIPQPPDGSTPGPDEPETVPGPAGSPLPVDVQDFPFASFQNAVAELGLDPEGVLGGTVSQRFDSLAPVARIGSLTGSITPIGQAPGSLESFFSDRFGDLDIAADTFRDLLAGRTGSDLDTDQLLAFAGLRDPDVSTSRGRGNAADVFRLARAAAEDRFGSFVASRLLPANARLFRELERRLAEGDAGTDFLQFARQQNLLPV